jgi:hypothetical protein
MSGKRQHFIPRFLQAGFASRGTNGDVFTWVHRKGEPAFECNTKNVGVEGQFYTEGADTTADDAITDAERAFSSLVALLRDSGPSAVIETAIPSLIAHFEFRTRHIRQNVIEAADYLLAGLAAFLSDTNAFSTYVERKIKNDPTLVRKPLADTLGWPQAVADAFVMQHLPQFIRKLAGEILPELDKLRRHFPERLAAAAKSGHIRALKEDVSPMRRTQRFQELEYATMRVTKGNMILGDSIVLFEVDGPQRYKTFLDGDDALRAVFVPLTPMLVLVGAPSGPATIPAELHEAVARSSFEYFISDRTSDENERLRARVGENAAILSREELDEIITEVMKQ